MKSKKLVFVGGRDVGLECIQALIKNREELAFIFCMHDEPHEVGQYYKEIAALAKKQKIPIKITKSVRSKEDVNILKKIKPCLMIVLGWRTIIPQEVLGVPSFGTVGMHYSLLPKYRGFAPVNWAVINGERKAGVSLFYLDEGIDTGRIVEQVKIPIHITDTAADVYQEAKSLSIEILLRNLEKLKSGNAQTRKQDERRATYTCARVPEDGKIDWNDSTLNIYNLIRGVSYPFPGAFTTYEGKKITIQKASLIKPQRKYVGRVCGRIVAIRETGVDILTGDGILRVNEIDSEAGKRLPANKVLRSIRGTLGW